jgi:tetratricopeptide (TPR) repeat protein
MFKLKSMSKSNIAAALEKARCYRFLNEPMEAESICLDILDVDPENQQAIITLILALTDQFRWELSTGHSRAKELLSRLNTNFHQAYYEGTICERRAKTHLRRGEYGSERMAYEWFRQAMENYEKAIEMSPVGNEDAILRWNACARLLMRHPGLVLPKEEPGESMLE